MGVYKGKSECLAVDDFGYCCKDNYLFFIYFIVKIFGFHGYFSDLFTGVLLWKTHREKVVIQIPTGSITSSILSLSL